jgi:hypothetical protein
LVVKDLSWGKLFWKKGRSWREKGTIYIDVQR